MGSYYGLAPALSISAQHDWMTSDLTLTCNGINVVGAYGYNFRREPDFVGGLKFYLECWYPMKIVSNPDDDPKFGTTEYAHDQKFNIPDLRRIIPSGNIIIVTKNHPDGVKVPVYFIDSVDSKAAAVASMPMQSLTSAASDDNSKMLDIPSLEMFVMLGKPFEISEPVPTGFGYIDFEYDDKYLVGLGGSVRQGQIHWKMNSLQLGVTQFIIYGGSGGSIGLWRRAILINIIEGSKTAA